jgi:demethylmenaquinone methyltransferase/2-methoxy-6-polyprenyl-1,4-benzoquinol methylase
MGNLDLLRDLKEPLPYQHPERIRGMFGSIAGRYDLANHLLSCGIDFYWRKRAAEIVENWQPKVMVDLATGTGDLALVLQRKLPEAEIIGADFSEEMLAIAKRKGVRKTMIADAMRLPFADGSVDCVTVAFGLRNMENYGGALREMSRVLNSNGHLLILEFSLPKMSILRGVYRFYLHRFLPVLGSILTRKKSAYDYLGDSIEAFPNGDAMIRLMESSGFSNAVVKPLTGGIVTLYTGEKL